MLCRLCLLDCDNLLEIFDTIGERLRIRYIIAQHFGFQLDSNDQISDKICHTCWLEIENFHAFYVDVRRAQNRLKIELENNTDPDPDTDEIDADVDNGFNSSDDVEDDENDVDDESDQSTIQGSSNCDGNYLGAICEDRSNITGDIDVFAAPSRTGSKILSGNSLKYKGYTNYISKANNSIIVVDIASSTYKSNEDPLEFWSTKHENNNGITNQDEFIRNRVKSLGIAGLNEIIDRNELSITAFSNTENDQSSLTSEEELSKYIQLNCELCGEKFKIFSNLKHHFRSAHKIIGYVVCCNEKLFNRSQLVNHVMKHLDRSRFLSNPTNNDTSDNRDSKQCPICRKRFEKTKMSRHLREHFQKKSTRAQCQQCGLWCKSRYILQKHMQSHIDDCNDFLCTICSKTFLSDVALQRHLTNVHYKERKFQCTMCNKAFKWSINLKEHMAIHTGERLYSCRYCSRKFNASSNLHSHRKKVHREEWEEERKKRLEVATNE